MTTVLARHFLPSKLRGERLTEVQYIPLEERTIQRDRPADMATGTSSSSSATKPTIGIVSIGDMGLAIAKLLQAYEYQVVTTSAGRRQASPVGTAGCG
jgi:phosphoglycerate dehydrogenase-like enzyme